MITESFVKKMEDIVGKEHVRRSGADMELYSYDASLITGMPGLVVFPASTEEVSQVMKEAHAAGIPSVGRGFATNLSGGTIIMHEGLVIVLSRFNEILEIQPESKYAVVQTGVTNLELQEAVAGHGHDVRGGVGGLRGQEVELLALVVDEANANLDAGLLLELLVRS